MRRRLRALRLLHPYPSLLNALLVGLIAAVAGAELATTLLLSGAMLGMQFAIGVTNDIVDQDLDARGKPHKPLPAGLVGARTAAGVAVGSAVAGFAAAALVDPVVAVLWLAMLACGQAYNFFLKPTPWAWACFSVAFALLPIYSWYGATGAVPPLWQFVVLLAVLAGPLLSVGNALIDLESDAAAGLRTPATLLGRRGSLVALSSLFAVIHVVAWAVLAPGASPLVLASLAAATSVGLLSLWLCVGMPARRQAGSNGQFLSVFLLAVAWLASAT